MFALPFSVSPGRHQMPVLLSCLVAGAAAIAGPVAVSHATGSLVALYQFQNAANLGADSSGNGNTLSLSAATYITQDTSGPYGSGSDGITIPGNGNANNDLLTTSALQSSSGAAGGVPAGVPLGDSAWTVAAWVQTTSPGGYSGTSQDGIIGWGQRSFPASGQPGPSMSFRLRDNGNPNTGLDDYYLGNDTVGTSTTVNISDGSWHFVAATWNGTDKTLYVDGAQIGQEALTNGLNLANQGFNIGADGSGSEPFDGNLSDVAIYNAALSASQLQSIQTTGNFAVAAVPEPGAIILLAAGASGMLLLRKRGRRITVA